MIVTRNIYGDDGKLTGQEASCDCKPVWTWTEFFIGTIGAFVFFALVTV